MPFTVEQFLEVFKSYNITVYPLQVIFNLLAVICIVLLLKKYNSGNKIINGILSFLWLWIGIVYHFIFFSLINKAAYFFGIMFITQSVVFFYNGVYMDYIQYELRKDWIGIVGGLFILYALLIYPILGYVLDHGYPTQPTFGLPCPTTIFTFGMLFFTTKKIKWHVYSIPFLWSLVGFTAAISLGILEDIGLLIAGLSGFSWLIRKKIIMKNA